MSRGTSWRTTSSSALGAADELADDVGRRDVGDPLERRGQLLERVASGHHLGDQPGLRAGDARPGRARARRPALTTDDLPIPDGPTTTSSRSRSRIATISAIGAVATEEVLGVGLLERLEAAVRVAGGHERRRRVGRDGERVAQLGQQLVDRPVAPAGIGVGRPADDAGGRTLADRQRPVQRWR